jgi:hypothetical protein
MTWDEFQDLHLEIAREVGAERSLRVQLAEPEYLHDPAFDVKPMMMRRWGFFRRRPKFREIAVAFYQLDDQTQPYFIMGNWVNLNELDKLNASAYRRDLAAAIRNGLEEEENRRLGLRGNIISADDVRAVAQKMGTSETMARIYLRSRGYQIRS